jgi:hypothetical protein
MACQCFHGRGVSLAALSFMLMIGVAAFGLEQRDQPRANVSCMAIAGVVTCFETGYVPIAPIPPSIAPMGPDVEGTDEDIVIRDDGGHHEVRG